MSFNKSTCPETQLLITCLNYPAASQDGIALL